MSALACATGVPFGDSRLPDRFWAKVTVAESGCWIWTGAKPGTTGYGSYMVRKGTMRGAHRVAYEALVAPIPRPLVIDHLCRVPLCVNPAHLEPVTQRENTIRGATGSATHCKRGHLFDDANTLRTKAGHRSCRACHTASQVDRYKAARASGVCCMCGALATKARCQSCADKVNRARTAVVR